MSFYARWVTSKADTADALVSDQELARIHHAATGKTAPSLSIQREVQQVLLGERQSAYAGSGYEFAESVMYQPGDDARFINWRLFARTGVYYRKSFYEERRPQVWLVLDRSPSMCFGTRVRLKLALAAQLALLHLFVAQRQQLLAGAILLDVQAEWLAPVQGQAGVQRLVQRVRQACPPPQQETVPHALPTLFAQLNTRLRAGCIVILYSDFHGLQASDMNALHALNERHCVMARHIVDPAELHLPQTGRFQFAGAQGQLSVDCHDAGLRADYAASMAARHAQIEQWLVQAGCLYRQYRADASLFEGDGIRHG